jgi:hypothetical protein
MMAADQPTEATAYPDSKVVIGANKAFTEAAPKLAEFLRAYSSTSAATSAMLAYMRENKASADDAAVHFLKTSDAWTRWLPADVAAPGQGGTRHLATVELGAPWCAPCCARGASDVSDIGTPIAEAVDTFVDWLVVTHGAFFEAVAGVFLAVLVPIEQVLRAAPPPVVLPPSR